MHLLFVALGLLQNIKLGNLIKVNKTSWGWDARPANAGTAFLLLLMSDHNFLLHSLTYIYTELRYKRILIFNTNEDIVRTGHNPIAVIDPKNYGGQLEDDTPVIVAHNLVHYESLHPIHKKDVEETIKLTKAYIAQPCRYEEIYGFTRNDIKYLVSSSSSEPIKETKQKLPEVNATKQNDNGSQEAHSSNRSDIFLFEKGTIKFSEN